MFITFQVILLSLPGSGEKHLVAFDNNSQFFSTVVGMVQCGGGSHLAAREPPTATRPDSLRQEIRLVCRQNKIPFKQ